MAKPSRRRRDRRIEALLIPGVRVTVGQGNEHVFAFSNPIKWEYELRGGPRHVRILRMVIEQEAPDETSNSDYR
jgi:hypothetical protein